MPAAIVLSSGVKHGSQIGAVLILLRKRGGSIWAMNITPSARERLAAAVASAILRKSAHCSPNH